MNMGRIFVVAAALLVLPLLGAFARGAGGFTWGEQYFDAQFSSYDLQTSYAGVYGYSVNYGGQRIGGFAMSIHSAMTDPVLNGGFVGAITGQEMRTGPFVAAVNLWAGFGGMSGSASLGLPGSLALFGELNLELGMGFIPGVMLTGYAGMQAVTGVSPEQPLFSSVMYTPVFGLRIAWGSF